MKIAISKSFSVVTHLRDSFEHVEPGFQQKREDGRLDDCSKPRRLKGLAVRYLNKVGCCKTAIQLYWNERREWN